MFRLFLASPKIQKLSSGPFLDTFNRFDPDFWTILQPLIHWYSAKKFVRPPAPEPNTTWFQGPSNVICYGVFFTGPPPENHKFLPKSNRPQTKMRVPRLPPPINSPDSGLGLPKIQFMSESWLLPTVKQKFTFNVTCSWLHLQECWALDLTNMIWNTAGLIGGAQCSVATAHKDGHGGVSGLLLLLILGESQSSY